MQAKKKLIASLPVPAQEELVRSRALEDIIRDLIAESPDNSIPFSEYMKIALYAPGLGYYSADSAKFGEAGDFVTAPTISPIFSRVVARQILRLFDEAPADLPRVILEIGAGDGEMTVEVLRHLGRRQALPECYRVWEISPHLRRQQRSRIERDLPDLASRMEWLDNPPSAGFEGIVIANEVLDADPFDRIRKHNGELLELHVGVSAGELAWANLPAGQETLEIVERIESDIAAALPDDFETEVPAREGRQIVDFMSSMKRGAALFFDYGLSRREYFAPDRDRGWLHCFYRHRVHDNPFLYPGLQDLTSWVDFSAFAGDAVDSGFDVAAYLPQAQFLMHGGMGQELDDLEGLSTEAQLQLAQQLRVLTMPGEMGEKIKCLLLAKSMDTVPQDLLIADRSHTL